MRSRKTDRHQEHIIPLGLQWVVLGVLYLLWKLSDLVNWFNNRRKVETRPRGLVDNPRDFTLYIEYND